MSTDVKNKGGKLTRRGFLKTTGVAAGVVAATGATATLAGVGASTASAESSAEETTFRGACRGNCGSRCPLEVTVREGKAVKVKPFKLDDQDFQRTRMCVKGFSQPQRVYDADRLKYPLKRVDGTERGAGEWERISWDDAIGLVAGKMGAALQEYGGTSIGFWSSYGSYGLLNGAMGGFMSIAYGRMATATGALIMGAGADTAQQHAQTTLLGIGGNDFVDVPNAKTIVCWGGNPAEAYVHAWQFVCKARENGAKLVTIDPQFTASAMHSDLYVPIIPATDGAMMLGMTNYIIENELIDEDYMKSNTVSPFLVKEDGTYLRMSDMGVTPTEGEVDATTGQPTLIDPVAVYDLSAKKIVALDDAKDLAITGSYDANGATVRPVFEVVKEKTAEYTVDKAAEISGAPAETIIELANLYATEGPVYTMTFQGIGHHVNSHHNYKNLAYLHAITGNAGKSGASICGAPSTGMYSYNSLAMMMGAPGPRMCGMYLPEIVNTGKWAGEDVNLRVLWCHNGNMLSCESGRQELIEAVKKVDFVVVADVNMTDTAQWADVVLPIPHAFETTDFDPVCSIPYPNYAEGGLEPLYECRSDFQIMKGVAELIGMGAMYEKTEEEYLHDVVDTEQNLAAGKGYDAFKAGELVRDYTYTPDRWVRVYGTDESSRLKYYIENPTPRNDFGQEIADFERHPYYTHANESYMENPLRKKYPLMGCSEHNKYHVHSQLAYTPVMRELEPEPMIKINASDAAERGISQGDVVKAYNDHGYVHIKALVTEGIKPGVISIPHGFQAEQFIEGHSQDLTNVYMNDFCSNSAFYDFLCEVEKI